MKNHAFTLIELLVVVLIIGILAAIALPQYRLAVEKSRASEALLALKSLASAYEVYVLANGNSELPTMDELDINFPGEDVRTWGYDFKQISPYFILGFSPSGTAHAIRKDKDGNNLYILAWYPKKEFVCLPSSDDYHAVCKALGGTDAGDLCGEGNNGKCYLLAL